jgi:hypothetical protein
VLLQPLDHAALWTDHVPAYVVGLFGLTFASGALFVVAFTRRWGPPLWTAVLVALLVRVAAAGLAYGHTPHDVAAYFRHAGELALHGRDPMTALPRFQWNFLPLMPYVFALEVRTGLPWEAVGKVAPILAELVITVLLAYLAPARYARTIPLLYALCPVAVLVSAVHGQVEPVALALGLGALLLARRGAPVGSGLLAGLAVATKTWPVLLAVGALRETPVRSWWRLALPAASALVAILLSIPVLLHDSLHNATQVLVSYRSFLGSWGWTGILHVLGVAGTGYEGPGVDRFQRLGTVLMAVALVLVVVVFRKADGVSLTTAVLLSFLAVTAGFGPQYLLWPVPFVLLTHRTGGIVFTLLASCYTTLFYLVALPYPQYASTINAVLAWGSLIVIGAAVAALPWKDRRADRSEADTAGREGPTTSQHDAEAAAELTR